MTADDIDRNLLTPEERAYWKDRIASARNDGLFTPPGLDESLALPGARGGSNWGTGAANASKGTVYLTTQDWPTLYRLRSEDPLGSRSRGAASPGVDVYRQRCQSCHALDRPGVAPALAGINARFTLEQFGNLVHSGRGEMPAFGDLNDTAVAALYGYLGSPAGVGGRNATAAGVSEKKPASGPVVASGGAPGARLASGRVRDTRRWEDRRIPTESTRPPFGTTPIGAFFPTSHTSSILRGRLWWRTT